MQQPLIIAHRGASALAPENTLAAFDLALRLGADGVETDLQVTADGVAVCVHDQTLERTTNGRGRVDEWAWADLRRLDAGAWFGEEFAGQRVPRLEDVLERYGAHTRLYLELKTQRAVDGAAEALAGVDASRVEVSSFEGETLAELSVRLPGVRRCLLAERWVSVGPDVQSIGVPASELDEARVKAAHARGLIVRAWAIPTPEEAVRLRRLGVDELTLDDPRW